MSGRGRVELREVMPPAIGSAFRDTEHLIPRPELKAFRGTGSSKIIGIDHALDLAVGERVSGPVLVGPNGQRLDRHGAGRIVRRVARRAGLDKPIGPHTLRHAFITAALDAGVPLRDVQEAPRPR